MKRTFKNLPDYNLFSFAYVQAHIQARHSLFTKLVELSKSTRQKQHFQLSVL